MGEEDICGCRDGIIGKFERCGLLGHNDGSAAA